MIYLSGSGSNRPGRISTTKGRGTKAKLSRAAYNNLGILYDQQGQYDKSTPAFQQALRLKPDDANAAYNLGLSYLRQGKPSEALDVLTQLLKRDPFYSKAYLQAGVAQSDLLHYPEAENLLKEIHPKSTLQNGVCLF